MSLTENFKIAVKCEHRICPVKYFIGKPKALIQTERANTQDEILNVCSFFC